MFLWRLNIEASVETLLQRLRKRTIKLGRSAGALLLQQAGVAGDALPLAIVENPRIGEASEMVVRFAAVGAFGDRHRSPPGIPIQIHFQVLDGDQARPELRVFDIGQELPRSLISPCHSVSTKVSAIMPSKARSSRCTWASFQRCSSTTSLVACGSFLSRACCPNAPNVSRRNQKIGLIIVGLIIVGLIIVDLTMAVTVPCAGTQTCAYAGKNITAGESSRHPKAHLEGVQMC
jgi:hypothetical protein